MRALALDFDTRSLCEKEAPEPRLNASTDVLFRVLEVGICGTDRELTGFRLGYPPTGSSYLIPGHEALGEVVAAGSDVTGLAAGDLVVPMVRRPCEPPCRACSADRRDLCVSGRYCERGIFGAHGYFAELAVDDAADLVAVPQPLAPFAVLTEPLSVVEKAVAMARRLHSGGAKSALVIGAGTIGLLAVLALRARGFQVSVISTEDSKSPRARLVEQCGAEYFVKFTGFADIVIEAAGAPEAVMTGMRSLAPLGVMIVLGAKETGGNLPLLDLIVGNRVIAGSVNASPQAFRDAVDDLGRFPAAILRTMIERTGFRDWRRTFQADAGTAPKIVQALV